MSDLFHENVPEDYVVAVAKVMVAAKWHTYQVLTKRSDRLRELLNSSLRFAANQKHIWWGVSVENKKYGLPRIENLQNAHAAIKFLSVEPLLEDLGKFDLKGVDWVIVGGESGHGARPMKKEWVVSLRDECKREGVPFFFKQWGGVRKKAAGRKLDGKTYDEFPQRTQHLVLSAEECLSLASRIESAFMKTNLVEISTSNMSRHELVVY
jgi:protein gp37